MDIYEFLIPDETITSAVSNACEFFGLPEVPIVNSEGVCVWSNYSQTTLDDVFGLNREQLSEMGIISDDSITLAYTHECAHRALQDFKDISCKNEELACDFFAGLYAGLNGLDSTQFEEALSNTIGGETHPDGEFRVKAVEFGKQTAEEIQAQGIVPTFEYCKDRFDDFLEYHVETVSPVTLFEKSLSGISFTGHVDDLYDPEIRSAHESAKYHHEQAAKSRNYDDWELHSKAEGEALHKEQYWKDCKTDAELEHAKTQAKHKYQDAIYHSYDISKIEEIYKK